MFTGSGSGEIPPSSFPFPEYELVIEPEDYPESAPGEKTEEVRMKEYEEYMKSREADGMLAAGTKVDADLERMAQSKEDRQFEKFKKRISHEPEQVRVCLCMHVFGGRCHCLFPLPKSYS